MATLSGNKIKDTYQSLVKFSDNGNITTSAKQLTDGFGNNSPMFVSTTQVGIGVTPESGLNLHVFGDAKIGSNLTVIGNLVVEGSTTTVGTDTLTVKDPLIVLANNNTSTDAVDIGFYGKYTPSGTTLYSGLFREALTGKYRLFKGLEVEPTTTVNTSGTGYAVATLIANLEGNVTGNLIGSVTGGTFSGTLLSNVAATTQSAGDNSTRVATTAYVDNQVGLYDTLSEVLANDNTTGGTDIAVSAGDDITFTDTSKSIYGTDGELEIHHNGTNSYITEDGTGALYLQGTYMYLTKSDGSQNYIELDLDGATDSRVKLNYGGATKLTTTSTGVSITGVISGLTDPSTAQDAATKNYVDTQVGANNELSEVLANGNTSGGTSMIISNGDDLTVNTSTLKVDSTNSQVGINNASPSGFTSDANDLIIGDGTSNRGMTIYSSSLGYGHLYFQDAESGSSTNGGFISYTHVGDAFEIGVAGNGQGAGSLSISETSVYTRENFIVDASFTSIYNTLTVDASSGKLGIRNNAPTYPLDVNGDARITGLTYLSSDLAVDTDTLFVDASEDSVGIGLTNPSDYSADELVISVPDTSGMTLVSAATDTAYITFAKGTTAAAQSNFISHDHSTDNLTIFSQAKVSIGIQEAIVAYFTDVDFFVDKSTTIDDTLTVNGNATFTSTSPELTIKSTNGAVGSGTSIGKLAWFTSDATTPTGAGNVTTMETKSTTSNGSDYAFIINKREGSGGGSCYMNLGGSSDGSISFGTNTSGAGTERMRIDSSGNVGIGTTPKAWTTAGGTKALQISTRAALWEAYNGTYLSNNMYYDGGEKYIESDEAAQISLGGDGTIYFQNAVSGIAGEALTWNERMRIDSSGNVGIGTDSPQSKLHVNGDIRRELDGTSTIGFGSGSTSAWYSGIKTVDFGAQNIGLTLFTTTNAGTTNVDALTIDEDGNVGIGTDSPSTILHASDVNGAVLRLERKDNNVLDGDLLGGIETYRDDDDGAYIQTYIKSYATEFYGRQGYMTFGTNNNNNGNATERMRITSDGYILLGTQGLPNGTSVYGSAFIPSSLSRTVLSQASSSTVASVLQVYRNPNGIVGSISMTNSTTAYNTTSDYRLKEDLQGFAGLDMVSKIPVYDFKWKTDESRSYGVMAHELQEVLPDAVTGDKDAINEDESINPQGVDYSKIVPLLVKSIQELKAEIESLKLQINN
jgi:hypothetical protein